MIAPDPHHSFRNATVFPVSLPILLKEIPSRLMLIAFVRTQKAFVDDTPAARNYFTSSTSSTKIATCKAYRKVTASEETATATALPPAKGAVVVSGIDLSEYLNAKSDETVMQRFMREDCPIQRFASSPWTARVDKL